MMWFPKIREDQYQVELYPKQVQSAIPSPASLVTSPVELHHCTHPDTQRQVPCRVTSKLTNNLDELYWNTH